MASNVIIDARREAYRIADVEVTMTVGELISLLENDFDSESKVYFSHDNGYTYGGLRFESIREQEEYNEEED